MQHWGFGGPLHDPGTKLELGAFTALPAAAAAAAGLIRCLGPHFEGAADMSTAFSQPLLSVRSVKNCLTTRRLC